MTLSLYKISNGTYIPHVTTYDLLTKKEELVLILQFNSDLSYQPQTLVNIYYNFKKKET